jgi:murein DD-endopeptidase MepM/ murein hydrolase activator NlpD
MHALLPARRAGRCVALVAALALFLACAPEAAAWEPPRLSIAPAEPAPGALVRVVLEDPNDDAGYVTPSGTMAGEPLHFVRAAPGMWRAIGAIPVDANGSVAAVAVIRRANRTDTVHASVTVPQPEPTRPPSQLAVSSRFTQPLDAATRARIDRENARAREVGRRAHSTPPMWTEPFLRPRDTRVTSGFGTGRMFNGRVSSRHLGVDFSGGVGAPVHAANRGVVALVDEFFLGGRVVYLDHGGGIVTGYLHLSETAVREGDVVERGQRIGAVGATGRVTGPHLHWNARYGALTVNPLELIELGRWFGNGGQ